MTRIRRRSAVALASIAGASSLLLAACTQDASSTDGTESVAPSASSEPPSAEPAVNGVDAKQYASSDPESDAFGFVTPSGKWLCAIIPDKKLAGCASHPTAGPLGVPGTPQIASPDGGPPAEADSSQSRRGRSRTSRTGMRHSFPATPMSSPMTPPSRSTDSVAMCSSRESRAGGCDGQGLYRRHERVQI